MHVVYFAPASPLSHPIARSLSLLPAIQLVLHPEGSVILIELCRSANEFIGAVARRPKGDIVTGRSGEPAAKLEY